jgi:non-homologous end joining protein Ku
MVKAKVKGQEPVIAKSPERGKVINLMDALRQSLGESQKPPAQSKRKDAKADAAPPAQQEAKKPRRASRKSA